MDEHDFSGSRLPRAERTPVICAQKVLYELRDVYESWCPDDPEHSFEKEVMSTAVAILSTTADVEEFISMVFGGPEAPREFKDLDKIFKAMLASCGLCLEAILADESGRRDIAWTYAFEAAYWCGIVAASNAKEIDKYIQKRERVEAAAAVRHKKSRAMRAEAEALWEALGHEFSSKDAAAEEFIKGRAVGFVAARRYFIGLSDKRPKK